MKSRIAVQVQKIRSTNFRIILAATLALLLMVSACKTRGEPGEEQIENARIAVAAIRDTLHVPADATLLAERLLYGTNPEFMPGCARGFILSAYQSPRNFEKILSEYREVLKTTGWEPSPYHSHDQDDFDIFVMGTQNFFEISDHPLRQDLLPVPTPTSSPDQSLSIYYLQLSHYDPAIIGCSG